MNMEKTIKICNQDYQKGENGYKVIKVNVSVPVENLYAVCTPIKKQ